MPNNAVAFIKIEGTLLPSDFVMDVTPNEGGAKTLHKEFVEYSKIIDGQLNQGVLEHLKENNINEIYLVADTDLSSTRLILARMVLIKTLEEQGFVVHGVIIPSDCVYLQDDSGELKPQLEAGRETMFSQAQRIVQQCLDSDLTLVGTRNEYDRTGTELMSSDVVRSGIFRARFSKHPLHLTRKIIQYFVAQNYSDSEPLKIIVIDHHADALQGITQDTLSPDWPEAVTVEFKKSTSGIGLIDVDETLLIGDVPVDIDESMSILIVKEKYRDVILKHLLNTDLLMHLKEQEITDLYLFTDMSVSGITSIIERMVLIEELQKKGFVVHGVIIPGDCSWLKENAELMGKMRNFLFTNSKELENFRAAMRKCNTQDRPDSLIAEVESLLGYQEVHQDLHQLGTGHTLMFSEAQKIVQSCLDSAPNGSVLSLAEAQARYRDEIGTLIPDTNSYKEFTDLMSLLHGFAHAKAEMLKYFMKGQFRNFVAKPHLSQSSADANKIRIVIADDRRDVLESIIQVTQLPDWSAQAFVELRRVTRENKVSFLFSAATMTSTTSNSSPSRTVGTVFAPSTAPTSIRPAKVQNISDFDCTVMVLLLGASRVGKSCVLSRFINNTYTESYSSTTRTTNFMKKPIDVGGNNSVTLQIGEAQTEIELQEIDVVILFYDSTDMKSFTDLEDTIGKIQRYGRPEITVIIAEAKCDCTRVVDSTVAKQFAKRHGFRFVSTSAKELININSLFHTAAITAMTKLYEKNRPALTEEQVSNSSCCMM